MIRPSLFLALLALALAAPAQERRISFNQDWRFLKGDAPGAEKPGFNDSTWRTLDLPHDWAIEGPFAQEHGPHQGGLPYLRHRLVPQAVHAAADGAGQDVYASSSTAPCRTPRVWLNGDELGGRPYGYIGFAFDLTPHLTFAARRTCWPCA